MVCNKKRKPVFIKRRFHVVFSGATILSFHPVEEFRIHLVIYKTSEGVGLRGVVVNVLDGNISVSEFELQSRYYVISWINIFRKGMNLLAMG